MPGSDQRTPPDPAGLEQLTKGHQMQDDSATARFRSYAKAVMPDVSDDAIEQAIQFTRLTLPTPQELEALASGTWTQTATGAMLDRIGEGYGVPRDGENDIEYRRRILASFPHEDTRPRGFTGRRDGDIVPVGRWRLRYFVEQREPAGWGGPPTEGWYVEEAAPDKHGHHRRIAEARDMEEARRIAALPELEERLTVRAPDAAR